MRILMTDGSGLTSRQCATVLSRAGHVVEALTSDPLCVCAFTRHVRRLHRVPPYGDDPFAWLEAALTVYEAGGFDVLLPTQEQVAVLSRAADGRAATVVPPFAALARVQDKLSAAATLAELGLPQPPQAIITSARDLAEWDVFPAYLKQPIGTATSGVMKLTGPEDLKDRPVEDGLVVQHEVPGPLAMIQTVFRGGSCLPSTPAAERAKARGAEPVASAASPCPRSATTWSSSAGRCAGTARCRRTPSSAPTGPSSSTSTRAWSSR
ncbi:hypothetical protein [Nonomuraea salmonea]|uniref:hypothetical protein n=1 Tax=Nonomuraea salmonea TaxID=46181 RepID=UPI002FEA18F2